MTKVIKAAIVLFLLSWIYTPVKATATIVVDHFKAKEVLTSIEKSYIGVMDKKSIYAELNKAFQSKNIKNISYLDVDITILPNDKLQLTMDYEAKVVLSQKYSLVYSMKIEH